MDVIKKRYPLLDEDGNPAAYPTYASQVYREDGTPLEQGGVLQGLKALDVYPVGSIYISAGEASPAALFGGTWERLEDRFLVAAGTKYAAGRTGKGNIETAMGPSNAENGSTSSGASYKGRVVVVTSSYANTDTEYMAYIQEKGISADPPYLAVYMWKRVS